MRRHPNRRRHLAITPRRDCAKINPREEPDRESKTTTRPVLGELRGDTKKKFERLRGTRLNSTSAHSLIEGAESYFMPSQSHTSTASRERDFA